MMANSEAVTTNAYELNVCYGDDVIGVLALDKTSSLLKLSYTPL